MGNCCYGNINENDILSDETCNNKKVYNINNNKLNEDNIIINQSRQNAYIDTNINTVVNNNNNINYTNINNSNLIISKQKLKLTIKQSKSLQEGKEYFINSLGVIFQNSRKRIAQPPDMCFAGFTDGNSQNESFPIR